jgi:PTH1 family peptidyl-tRNA hydrolase
MSRLLLVYDDVDLPMGRVRVRPKGSSGSHNGMKSVIYQLGSDEFPRIRIGIGSAPEGWDLADYVLSKFGNEDRRTINESVANAASAAAVWVSSGIEAAMNQYNSNRMDEI